MIPVPSEAVAVRLASLAVHVDEYGRGNVVTDLDLIAATTLAGDPAVRAWLAQIDPVLLPVPRDALDRDEAAMVRISVKREGRPGVYLADRASLIEWIRAQRFDAIHSFASAGGVMLGADCDPESVIDAIEPALTVAITTGAMQAEQMRHALAIVSPPDPGTLRVYDVGELTEAEHLDVMDDEPDVPAVTPAEVRAHHDEHHGGSFASCSAPECMAAVMASEA